MQECKQELSLKCALPPPLPNKGYDDDQSITFGPCIRISNCTFRNNSVETIPIGSTIDDDRTGFEDENQIPSIGASGGDNNTTRNDTSEEPMKSASELFEGRGQIFERIFVGRGGGVALIINGSVAADVVVSEVQFVENSAVESGGGAYVLLQGFTNHSVTINQSRYVCSWLEELANLLC